MICTWTVSVSSGFTNFAICGSDDMQYRSTFSTEEHSVILLNTDETFIIIISIIISSKYFFGNLYLLPLNTIQYFKSIIYTYSIYRGKDK